MPKGFKSNYNSANGKFRHLKLADPGKSEIKPTFSMTKPRACIRIADLVRLKFKIKSQYCH